MVKRIIFSIKLMFKNAALLSMIKIIFMIISALSVPFSFYVIENMIESITNIGQTSFSLYITILWIIIFTAINLWGIIQRHISDLVQLMITKKLKENMLPSLADKVCHIQYSYFEDPESRDIFHRLGDAPHEMVLNIFDTTLNLFRDTISIVGIAFLFTRISNLFFFIFIIILLPVLWCDYRSTIIIRRMHREQTYAERELSYYDGLLSDKYALHELKIMNSIKYIQGIWHHKAKLVLKEHMKSTAKSQMLMLSSTLLLFVFSASTMGLLLYNVINKSISIGTFVVLVNSIQSIYSISFSLSDSVTLLSRELYKIEYFEELFLMSEVQKGNETLSTNEYEIVFEHVSFSYPNTNNQVLDDVSLRIKPGEKVCIVGRNGAGKSTIIKLLCGLYYPDSGKIEINGVNINDISVKLMKNIRSVVFQDYFKYYSTIRENVAYGDLNKITDDLAIYNALNHAQAHGFMNLMENKLETNLGNIEDDGVDLSGGQWQKIAIARARLPDSSFIILDEPTASLDPVAESIMYNTFSEVLKNKGYIFISHRLASAKMADRIIVIDGGRIIEDGNHDNLMEQQGVYYKMFKEQSCWYVNEEGE